MPKGFAGPRPGLEFSGPKLRLEFDPNENTLELASDILMRTQGITLRPLFALSIIANEYLLYGEIGL